MATFIILPVDHLRIHETNAKVRKKTRSIGALLKNFRSLVARVTLIWAFTMLSALGLGQSGVTPPQASAPQGVPRLVKFSGQLKDSSGNWLTGTVGVMFAVYSDQTGGAPVWQETQNVPFSQGRYTVFLGNSTSAGIPAELFASGQSQWLGVTALLPGETEQPRVLLASVPYALKAVDADTLGGVPASSYVRANTVNAAGVTTPAIVPASGTVSPSATPVVAPTGQASPNSGSLTHPSTATGDESGTVSLSDSTSASYAFRKKWVSPPVCTLTPTSDPHAVGGYWVTSSISTLTANVHYAGRITFNFRCQAATNF